MAIIGRVANGQARETLVGKSTRDSETMAAVEVETDPGNSSLLVVLREETTCSRDLLLWGLKGGRTKFCAGPPTCVSHNST